MKKSKKSNKNQDKKIRKEQNKRIRIIKSWLKKIEESNLSIKEFFEKNKVPFTRSQYFVYRKKLEELGEEGLLDNRPKSGGKKLTAEAEAFIKGCIASNPEVSPKMLQEHLEKQFGITVSPSGVTRMLKRLNPEAKKRSRGRPRLEESKPSTIAMEAWK